MKRNGTVPLSSRRPGPRPAGVAPASCLRLTRAHPWPAPCGRPTGVAPASCLRLTRAIALIERADLTCRCLEVYLRGRKLRWVRVLLSEERAVNLKGSKTEKNLKDAFSGESQANRRYLYFAAKADVEGFNDVSAVFRSTAEGETGHAHGHLEYLEAVGDPATGLPIGATSLNLKAAIAGETHEYTDMYPGMAKSAREEGFNEIAGWFETLAKAERSHANRFQKALDSI